jgi:hypothetical protein
VARFGTANEHSDWETAHHVFTYANAVQQALKRIGSGTPDPAEAVRGLLHGAMALYLARYLNVPPASLPGESGEGLDDLPAEAKEIRAALLDTFDRQQQIGAESQLEVSRNVLREIGAEIVPSHLLLNKIDRVSEVDRTALRAKYPDAILLSAKSPEDVAALRETIIAFFEAAMVEDQFVLPYAKQGLLGHLYANVRVVSESPRPTTAPAGS